MASKQMEEIQRKLAVLAYPRANAPAQALLFAGVERYRLLEWLFFRYAATHATFPISASQSARLAAQLRVDLVRVLFPPYSPNSKLRVSFSLCCGGS